MLRFLTFKPCLLVVLCRLAKRDRILNAAAPWRSPFRKITFKKYVSHFVTPFPEGPRIEKIQTREAILKKLSFQYGMRCSIENGFFIPGPSLAAEKQGLGLKFSIENEMF